MQVIFEKCLIESYVFKYQNISQFLGYRINRYVAGCFEGILKSESNLANSSKGASIWKYLHCTNQD